MLYKDLLTKQKALVTVTCQIQNFSAGAIVFYLQDPSVLLNIDPIDPTRYPYVPLPVRVVIHTRYEDSSISDPLYVSAFSNHIEILGDASFLITRPQRAVLLFEAVRS